MKLTRALKINVQISSLVVGGTCRDEARLVMSSFLKK